MNTPGRTDPGTAVPNHTLRAGGHEAPRHGRGIASGAVREALRLMFFATRVERILGITDASNLPSIRLLERLGFEFAESLRVVFRGEPCTELVYSLPRAGGYATGV